MMIPKPRKITISAAQHNISSNQLMSNYLTQTAAQQMLAGGDHLNGTLPGANNMQMAVFDPRMPIPYSLLLSLPANVIRLQAQKKQMPNDFAGGLSSDPTSASFEKAQREKQFGGPMMDANDLLQGMLNPGLFGIGGVAGGVGAMDMPFANNKDLFNISDLNQFEDMAITKNVLTNFFLLAKVRTGP